MLEIFQNLDLLSVGFVVAATVVFGFIVYFNNPKSITNKTFFAFALITAAWGMFNYISYQFESPFVTLWLLRLVMFFAVWQSFTMFLFCYAFPEPNRYLSKLVRYFLLPWVSILSVLTLTPFIFVEAMRFLQSGRVANPTINPLGILSFGITTVPLVTYGLYILLNKTIQSFKHRAEKRSNYLIILIGLFSSLGLIITFNFVFPVFLENVNWIPLGALFFFPFATFTSYAILRHKLFDVRAMWAGVLVFLLAIVAFLEVIFARDLILIIYRSSIFLLILMFGIILIREIMREVRQREEIQELAGRLKSVNNVLSHDVKTILGKNRDMFITLLEGTFGVIPDKAKPLLERSFADSKKMILAITNIFAAGRDMVLTVKPFDFKEAILEAAREVSKEVEEKHLAIKINIPEGDYMITADETQLTNHVLANLLENAINYNIENGSIILSLVRKDPTTLLFTVQDTGVGIKEEDKPNMFKEGGRGKESIKINVHSSGYGLATAKKTVEAHGGKIWFESEGVPGKGATFFVEFPAIAKPSVSSFQPRA